MTVREFEVLEALTGLEHPHTTAVDISAVAGQFDPRATGYSLRALAARGLVEPAGRRHGGSWKWAVTNKGAKVLSA